MCKPISEHTETAKVSSYSDGDKLAISLKPCDNEVQIRTYRKEDEAQCQALFIKGRMSLLPDYYKVVLFRSNESAVFYMLLLVALLYLPIWTVGLMLLLWCSVWYGVVQRAFRMYLACQFKKDMNDIYGSYMKTGGTFLVATMGGKVVGMVGGREHLKKENFFLVCRMNVDERAQKRGIAGRLMTRLEQFARQEGYQTMTLTCTTAQLAAHSLYRKNGFVLRAKKPSLAGLSGVDICIFQKQLV